MSCPYCGKKVESGWRFCRYCNKPLIASVKFKDSSKINHKFDEIPQEINDLDNSYTFFEANVIEDEEIDKELSSINKSLDELNYSSEPIGHLLLKKASLYYKKRDFNESLRNLNDALYYFKSEKDILNLAVVHNEIGLIKEELGFFEESIYQFDAALDILDGLNEKGKIVQVYNNLGNVYHLIKDVENSYKYYQKALTISEESNLLYEEVKSSSNLVEILFTLKDFERISRILDRNYHFFNDNNDKYGTIITLIKYGKLCYYKGEDYYDQSLNHFSDALVLINDSSFEVSVYEKAKMEWEIYHFVGKIYLVYENYVESEENLQKSLESVRTFEVRENIKEGIILEDLANLYYQNGNYQKSLEYYELSIEIYQKFGEKGKIADNLSAVASLNVNNINNKRVALNYYKQALDLYEELNYTKDVAEILLNIGDIYLSQSDFQSALSAFQEAEQHYKILQDELKRNQILKKIDYITDRI